MTVDVNEAARAAVADVRKKWGETSIMKLDEAIDMDVEAISTGNIEIDLASGVGGMPKGRIIEIYGPESSGKSTFCLHVLANAQAEGGEVAFIDVEHALDPKYAKALGVDTSNLYVSQPGYGEEALEIAKGLTESGGFSVIVIDSVAALTPQSEVEGEIGDANVGKHARMMSQALRMMVPIVKKTGTIVIFTNQIREKVGVLFGSPETTPGGRALKFYSSIRLDIRRKGQNKEGGEIVGNEHTLKFVKNKVAPPFKEVELKLEYGKGFLNDISLLRAGVDRNLVNKAGAWYSTLDGEKMGQGEEKAAKFILDNPTFAQELREAILATG